MDRVGGFFTEEFRQNDERMGFEICTIPDGKRGILAKKGLWSPYRVGSYGVDLEDFELLACRAVENTLDTGKIIVIDEIGKMELFSPLFKDVLQKALDSLQPVLATIIQRPNLYADKIKERKDIQLLTLTRNNFLPIWNSAQNLLSKCPPGGTF